MLLERQVYDLTGNYMGYWHLSIDGHGCHHNNSEDIDANLASAAFVETLRKMGQHIEKATFTYGGKEELTPTSISVVEPKVSRSS